MNNSTITRTLAGGIRLSVVAALLALLTGLLAVTQPARANNYVVTNTNDSGRGSLRQAITNANNNPGADTITFAATTDGNPIVLAEAAGENANVSGDLDILNGGDLTIQGNGTANTIVDGGGIDRVFHVCPSGVCAHTVTFSGVTIRNGSTADYGGGIRNEAGTTIVDSSTVSANMAYYGGGIFNAATLNVQNGSIIGGVGAGNQANLGGGIYNRGGTTTVTGSTVSANTAIYGGGILNEATLNVQNGSTIGGAGAGNTATNGGGGIYNETGTTTVNGSTVNANTASWGGGIYNRTGTTTVDGSTVSANTANSDGGGIYNWGSTTTVTGSRILNNTATTNGGGVYNNDNHAGATSVTSSCIVDNSATSYFNNQTAQQIATGNWWGAATGPNTPGADTVGGGSVDTSGYLTKPILGCYFYVYLPLVLK